MRLVRRPRRKGLSLLEVIVAMAIFLLATVVISQMMHSAAGSANQARLQTRASILAESEMNKLAKVPKLFVSMDRLAPVADAEPGWYYQVSILPLSGTELSLDNQSVGGLNTVHVRVVWMPDGQYPEAEYTLTRQLMDPRLTLPEQPSSAPTVNQENKTPETPMQ